MGKGGGVIGFIFVLYLTEIALNLWRFELYGARPPMCISGDGDLRPLEYCGPCRTQVGRRRYYSP